MSPRPMFFIVRSPAATTAQGSTEALGPIVPLIAVDELPDWIEISGAPRELAVEGIVGLKNLGTWPKTEAVYPIRIAYSMAALPSAGVPTAELAGVELAEQPKTVYTVPAVAAGSAGAGSVRRAVAEPSQLAQPVKATTTGQVNRPPLTTPGLQNSIHNPNNSKQAPRLAPAPASTAAATTLAATTTASPANKTQTAATSFPSSSAPAPAPTSVASQTPETAEYCRHWCHHGTCKWGAQCRYLHTMPTTAQDLVEVGLREFPQWWIIAMFRSLSLGALPSPSSSSSSPSPDLAMGGVIGSAGAVVPLAASSAVPPGGVSASVGTGAVTDAVKVTGTDTGGRVNTSPLRPSTAALAAMRSLGVQPQPQTHPRPHPQPQLHHPPKGQHQNQNQQGISPSNKKLKAQLREAVSLLHQLGVATPGIYKGGSGGRAQRGRDITTPLDRKLKLGLPGGVNMPPGLGNVTGAVTGAVNGGGNGSVGVSGMGKERLGVEAAMAAIIRDGVQPLKMADVKAPEQTQLGVGMGKAQGLARAGRQEQQAGAVGGEKRLDGSRRGVQGAPGTVMQSVVVEKLIDV